MAPVFGLRPEQAPTSAQDFFALINPDDRDLVETSLAQAAAAGTDFKEEFRIVWPYGSVHGIDGRARISSGTEGESQNWQQAEEQVLAAADMQEALDVSDACPTPIHLILTDIVLPTGNGMALAEALLAKRRNFSARK